MEKACRTCGETKPLHEFYHNRGYADGHGIDCKPCHRTRLAEAQMKPPKRPAPEGMKRCTLCKDTKPATEFYRDKNFYDGLSPACKACRRLRHGEWRKKNLATVAENQRRHYRKNPERYAEYERKRRYGLQPGDYERMLDDQQGRCAICGTDDPAPRKHFHVDHDHNTGAVRGLLCGPRNSGIGHLKHSLPILQEAIKYLSQKPRYSTR